MDKVLCLLKLNNSITANTLNEIRKLAISKGGFDPQYRRYIWMKLLDVKYTSLTNKNFMIKNDTDNTIVLNLRKSKMRDKSDVNKVLFLDIPRTNYDDSSNKFLRDLFKNKAPDLFRCKPLNYDYYQGFLDIAWYLFNVLHDENDRQCNDAFIGIQHFAEAFVKDYLTQEHMSTTITDLFRRFIEVLEPKLMEKVKQANFYLETCIGWHLTLFAHFISDSSIMNRVLDYFLCSPPYTVYLFSIILLQNILLHKDKADDDDQFININDVEYTKINFDQLIIETEQYLTNSQSMSVINKVLNEFYPRFPCICASIKKNQSNKIKASMIAITYAVVFIVLIYIQILINK